PAAVGMVAGGAGGDARAGDEPRPALGHGFYRRADRMAALPHLVWSAAARAPAARLADDCRACRDLADPWHAARNCRRQRAVDRDGRSQTARKPWPARLFPAAGHHAVYRAVGFSLRAVRLAGRLHAAGAVVGR